MTLGIGVITRNRVDCCAEVVDAIGRHTLTDHDLVVSVDPADTTGTAKKVDARCVTASKSGIPAVRNRVLAELAGYDVIAIFEDDHKPAVDGWDLHYLNMLEQGVTDVLLARTDGPTTHTLNTGAGTIVWRQNMGCTLIVLTDLAYRTVGAWNPLFGTRYGMDDGEWVNRARRAGLIGAHPGYPTLADSTTLTVDVPNPPSSDNKTQAQRMAEANLNMQHALSAAHRPVWVANPEALPQPAV